MSTEERPLSPLGSRPIMMVGKGRLSHTESRRPPRAQLQGLLFSFPQSAQEYRQRSLLEKELLFFAYDIFGIPFVDPVSPSGGWRGKWGSTEGPGGGAALGSPSQRQV